VGGSWTEHSTNIPSGESLVRQHLYAKRYFKEKFGVDVKIWLAAGLLRLQLELAPNLP
jgi:alpha-mannosidase